MSWFSQKEPKKTRWPIDGHGVRPPGPRPGPASRTIVTVRDVEDLRGLTSRVEKLESAMGDAERLFSDMADIVERSIDDPLPSPELRARMVKKMTEIRYVLWSKK